MKKVLSEKLPNWLMDRLPKYETVESIPQAFSDSTHNLWRLQGSDLDHKNHFLKVCSNTESPFWQIMDDLFDFVLNTEIANLSDTYEFLQKVCSLEIPELIRVETVSNKNAYILTTELDGYALDSNINDQMVRQLANHLAELHSIPSTNWGKISNPRFNSADWSKRLRGTLINSDKKWGGVLLQSDSNSKDYLKQALDACALIGTTEFIPMMPDLRWDQFIQKNGVMTALVDLDAFVYAPRELDFVILEYILSPNQIGVFSEVYTKIQTIPDIEQVRPAYRLLLFYMQILGETDLDGWMNKEIIF